MFKRKKALGNSLNFPYPPAPLKDKQLILTMVNPFQENLQQSGVYKIMNFINLLKEHSKIGNAPRSSKCQRIINRKDLCLIIKFLMDNSNCQLEIKIREFRRSSNDQKNIIFTFFASKYPSLMRIVCQNNFKSFKFSDNLYQVEDLTKKWLQYIDDVQMMNQKKMISSMYDEPVITENDFLSEINFDSDDSMFPQIGTCDL